MNIDYTSRDYQSIREDLIALVKERIPSWTAEDPADFGLALVEALAYVGDITSYYTDRVVNEAYLSTATQRQSLIDIARMLGYTPSTAVSATIGSMRVHNPTSSDLRIYTGTQFVTNVDDGGVQRTATFECQINSPITAWSPNSSLVVPAMASVVVPATQGLTVFQSVLGVSDGSADQEFTIPTASLIEGSVQIVTGIIGGYAGQGMNSNPEYGYARYGETLWDAGPDLYSRATGITALHATDRAFFLLVDADSVRVRFGDGVNGKIPVKDHKVYATYRTGGGRFGNIPAGTRLLGPDSLYAIAESGAYGGTDYESNDSIRRNAPATFRSRGRAVTRQDYEDIALTSPGISKAQARANNTTSVTVYIAPAASSSLAPGFYSSAVVKRMVSVAGGTATYTLTLAASLPGDLTSIIVSGIGCGFDATLSAGNFTYSEESGAAPTLSWSVPITGVIDELSISGPPGDPRGGYAAVSSAPFTQVGERVIVDTGGVVVTVTQVNPDGFAFSYDTAPDPALQAFTRVSVGETASSGVVTGAEDPSFTALRKAVESDLEQRSSIGTDVTVSGPQYLDVQLAVTIYVEPTVRRSTAIRAAKDLLLEMFSYDMAQMNHLVRRQQVALELARLAEVGYATVDVLRLSGGNDQNELSAGIGTLLRLLPGGDRAYSASAGSGQEIDTYHEGNLTIRVESGTGINDLGLAP